MQLPIINLYSYFQNLSHNPIEDERHLVTYIFSGKNYSKSSNNGPNEESYISEDNYIHLSINNGRIYCVDWRDHCGFLDRRDFYKAGKLSSSEFFSDEGRLLLQQYYNDSGLPVLTFYYRGADSHKSALTMIHLKYKEAVTLLKI